MATAEVVDLRDYAQVIWRRRRLVAVTTVVVMLLSLGVAFSQARTYQSLTKVLVLPATLPGTQIAPGQLISMPNELEIAGSASVAAAAERIAWRDGVDIGTVDVSSPTETETLDFQSSARDGRSAQITAQAYATAYLEFREGNLLSGIKTRSDSVDALLASLTLEQSQLIEQIVRTDEAAEAAALQFQLNTVNNEIRLRQQEQIELELAANTQVGRILQNAEVPLGPANPRPVRNLILGAVLGFLFGIALALLRDRLDQGIKSREDVEAVTGTTVLGYIPEAPSLHRLISVLPGGDPLAAEAFRSLRARLLFGASRDGFRTVMVTSAVEGEGKTATAANLAVALAQAETRTTLVSGDMHHPGLWRYLPERGQRGLADVLAGSSRLPEVLIQTDQDNLTLLPSGTLAKLPEAALGSADMLRIFGALLEDADLVLIDSAPVLGVSDTLELASLVDGVVLTVDGSQARKDLVREAVGELRSIGATILGVVLVRPDGHSFEKYSYKYGRRETQGAAGDLATPPRPESAQARR